MHRFWCRGNVSFLSSQSLPEMTLYDIFLPSGAVEKPLMRALAVLGALAAGFLVWARLGCRHDVRSAPIGDEQLCLECGSRRRFVLGEQPGLWRK